MNTITWMLVGGALGLAAYSFLRLNAQRGQMASIVLGALGGFVGGKMVAPLLAIAAAPDELNVPALIVAAAVAAAFLAAGHVLQNRWGV